jgi:hypothetical protein
VTRHQDKFSSDLFKESLYGVGAAVELTITRGASTKVFRLRNAVISSFSIAGHGGGETPFESFTIEGEFVSPTGP